MEKNLSELSPKVISINISNGGIPKYPTDRVEVLQRGLEGDGHNHSKHYRAIQAVSIQDIETLEQLKSEGYNLFAGAIGENLTVKNLHVNRLPIGTIIRFSSGVKLELSKVREPCYVLDSIDPKLKQDISGRCGFYARVVEEGSVSVNDILTIQVPTHLEIIHS